MSTGAITRFRCENIGFIFQQFNLIPSLSPSWSGLVRSVGQATPPAQYSSRSQSAWPAAASSQLAQVGCRPRQSLVVGSRESVVQAAPVPGQKSSTSQMPAEARQTTLVGLNEFALQALVAGSPEQVSATSQMPASARQTVPAVLTESTGQALAVPSQVSTLSQTPPEARQIVPEVFTLSTGHSVLDPVQVSTMSQTSDLARHSAPELPAGWVQMLPVPLQTSREQGLPSSVQTVFVGTLPSLLQLFPLPGQ